MMPAGWLTDVSRLPVPVIGAVTLAAMLLGAAIGHTFRIWQTKRPKRKIHESGASVAQEAYLFSGMLGLLGLLLAFSFGMVLDRYESRRTLAVEEANAIGTAYLRAQLLDEPHRSRLSNLLLSYTANRIKLASAAGDNRAHLANNDRLLTDIWAAVTSARESALARGTTTALLLAFNDVIDLDTKRKLAWELRLPAEVLVLLIWYLIITAAVAGYQVDGPRGRRAALVLFALIALSLTFITEINRPMSGRERDVEKPMLMLLQSLRAQPPHVFDQFGAGEGEAPR